MNMKYNSKRQTAQFRQEQIEDRMIINSERQIKKYKNRIWGTMIYILKYYIYIIFISSQVENACVLPQIF